MRGQPIAAPYESSSARTATRRTPNSISSLFRPVLLSKFLYHRLHGFGVSQRSSLELLPITVTAEVSWINNRAGFGTK